MRKMFKKAKDGFTLVELVVVIAIIAILSGVSVAVYTGITENTRKTVANSDANEIANVVRASVLTDADGYEFQMSETNQATTANPYAENLDLNCKATWDSEKGLVFAVKNGGVWKDVNSSTTTYGAFDEASAILSIYMQSEQITDVTKVGTVTVTGPKNNSVVINGYADKFTYTTTGGYTSGTVSILAGGTEN